MPEAAVGILTDLFWFSCFPQTLHGALQRHVVWRGYKYLPFCWAYARIIVAEAIWFAVISKETHQAYNYHVIAHTWRRWKGGITSNMEIGEIKFYVVNELVSLLYRNPFGWPFLLL